MILAFAENIKQDKNNGYLLKVLKQRLLFQIQFPLTDEPIVHF